MTEIERFWAEITAIALIARSSIGSPWWVPREGVGWSGVPPR
jgi:hypothetical protein